MCLRFCGGRTWEQICKERPLLNVMYYPESPQWNLVPCASTITTPTLIHDAACIIDRLFRTAHALTFRLSMQPAAAPMPADDQLKYTCILPTSWQSSIFSTGADISYIYNPEIIDLCSQGLGEILLYSALSRLYIRRPDTGIHSLLFYFLFLLHHHTRNRDFSFLIVWRSIKYEQQRPQYTFWTCICGLPPALQQVSQKHRAMH